MKMGLLKRIRQKRQAVHDSIKGAAQELCFGIGVRFKLKERIEALNKLAGLHPKRTAALTIGALTLSLAVNLMLSSGGKSEAIPDFRNIADVQPMFEGMRQIQSAKTMGQRIVVGFVDEGQRLRRELDSLVALPIKSHKDSVQIVAKYKQLEKIVDKLNTQ